MNEYQSPYGFSGGGNFGGMRQDRPPVVEETIKTDKVLKDMPLVKQSRLSVAPLTEAQAKRLLQLAQTKL